MSYAASAYQQHSGSYLPGRTVEALVLEQNNLNLTQATTQIARHAALSSTLKLWSILLRGLDHSDCELSPILRQDVISVGTWCTRYANEALNRPLPLTPLVDIQQDIIDGLRASPSPGQTETLGADMGSAPALAVVG